MFDWFETSRDSLIMVAIGGIVTGWTAMLIYMGQKWMERNENRSNYASILNDEVERNLNRYSQELITHIQIPNLAPTNNVYHGLLSSGNIKYFDRGLRNDLDELYTRFVMERSKSTYDASLFKSVLSKLEKMERKKRLGLF